MNDFFHTKQFSNDDSYEQKQHSNIILISFAEVELLLHVLSTSVLHLNFTQMTPKMKWV